MEKDRERLRRMGLALEDLDVATVSRVEMEEVVAGANAIFVEGGTSYYLLEKVLDSGLGGLLREAVAAGTPCVGMSGAHCSSAPTSLRCRW